MLLLYPMIQASMTKSMIKAEKESPLFPHNKLSDLHNIQYKDEGDGTVAVWYVREDYAKINLEGGTTSYNVTDIIMSDRDRQVSRERSKRSKKEGKTLQ